MARPLRIEYPGACYHVTCRGNMGHQVFFSDRHYGLFLEKLEEFSALFSVKVRCYCLMPNHVHLYLQTTEANMSRFMQSFLTSFCVSMNRMRGKSGHIFQGRFKSHLVQDELYRSKLSRYIHLNPVRIRTLNTLPASRKLEILENFKWSSYPVYAGLREASDRLDLEPVLSTWGMDAGSRRSAYRNYVEAGLRKGVEELWSEVKEQHVLGDDVFLAKVRRSLLPAVLKPEDAKEQRALSRLKRSFDFEDVLNAVSKVLEVKEEELLTRRSKHADGRKLLMYCLCKYSRASASLAELASGTSVSRSGLLIARDRFEKSLESNELFKRNLNGVVDFLCK
ncbi:MAG: transposase [Victivallales bacterium]